jgi:hypothetical protein
VGGTVQVEASSVTGIGELLILNHGLSGSRIEWIDGVSTPTVVPMVAIPSHEHRAFWRRVVRGWGLLYMGDLHRRSSRDHGSLRICDGSCLCIDHDSLLGCAEAI